MFAKIPTPSNSKIWTPIGPSVSIPCFFAHKDPQPPAASQTRLSKRLFPRYPTLRPVASRREGRCWNKIPRRIAPKSIYIIGPYLTSCVSTSLIWSIDHPSLLTPLRLVSKTAFTAAKCSPMLASLPAKWEPKCATCSPSWRCTCPAWNPGNRKKISRLWEMVSTVFSVF